MTIEASDPGPAWRLAFRRRAPLFVRIFVMMLLAVAAAQALNVIVVLMVRLPSAPTYSYVEIARALRDGDGEDRLSVVISADAPAQASQDTRDREAAHRLAQTLDVEAPRVRVTIARPPRVDDHDARGRDLALFPKPPRELRAPLHETDRGDVIVGRFVAALDLGAGRWRIVRPRGGAIDPWQWQALLWFGGAVFLAAPIAWLIARSIARPIDLFAAAAERLGRDPTAPPLALKGPPEIVAAAKAFNAMQARLQRYVDSRITMAAAVAHDLRTPLMRLSLLLDDTPEAARRAAEAEIAQMTARIAAILATMRGVSQSGERQSLNLRTLVESVADEIADRGYDIAVLPGDDVVVSADVAAIKALLANLSENAVQYGESARISLTKSETNALIAITDAGPGIDERDLERVFEPFHRLERSRSPDTGGAGLGLTSARAIARAHGGDVGLSNRPEGGVIALVSLPL